MPVNKLSCFVERRYDFFEEASDAVFFLLSKLVFECFLLGSKAGGRRESRRHEKDEDDRQGVNHAMVHF